MELDYISAVSMETIRDNYYRQPKHVSKFNVTFAWSHMSPWRLVAAGLLLIIFVVPVAMATSSDRPPTFLEEPRAAVVRSGSKVVLRCRATGGASISWLRDGIAVTTETLPGVDIEGDYLVIPALSVSSSPLSDPGTGVASTSGQEGVYQCVASNRLGAVISREAKVEVAYIGNFYEGFRDMYVNVTEGNVAFIPCAPPSGRPQPITSFDVNGTEIDLAYSHYRLLPSGNLQISAVRSHDNGRYRCLATNPITGDTRHAKNSVHLRVVSPVTNQAPIFRWVPPSEVRVSSGDNLTLECVVEGAPVPVVTWSKYGGKLPADRHRQILGNLEIRNVGRLDEGTYICGASNGVGTQQVAITEVSIAEPPIIEEPPANQEVTEGSSATFTCQGQSDAVRRQEDTGLTTKWYHDGTMLTDDGGRTSITASALTLRDISLHQSGVYQCILQNSLGSVTMAAILNVIKATKESRATDQRRPQHSAGQEEMLGIAPDLAGGGFGLTTRNIPHQYVSTTTVRPVSDAILEISDPLEADGLGTSGGRRKSNGRGHQTGESPGGKTQSQEGLEMVPPSRPHVERLSDTSVLLEWTVDEPSSGNSGLPITFYKVQYKEMVSDRQRRRWRTIETDIAANQRQFEVPGLRPGSTYRFRIVAVYSNNDNLHSPNSRKLKLRKGPKEPLPEAPVTGPVIVEAVATESAIHLRWQYLPEDWTPVEGFHIYYGTYGSQGPEELRQTVNGSHLREAEIADLIPNTMYSIRMKGYNIAGESHFSNIVVKRTSDDDYEYPAWVPDPSSVDDSAATTGPPDMTGADAPSILNGGSSSTAAGDSNRLMYIILGGLLGGLVLFLLLIMAACAWKQKNANTMLAAIEGRCKFHDPSRTIYAADTIRHKQTNGSAAGMFLLNGLSSSSQQQQQHRHENGGPEGQQTLYSVHTPTEPDPLLGGHYCEDHRDGGLRTSGISDVWEEIPPPPPPPLSDGCGSSGEEEEGRDSYGVGEWEEDERDREEEVLTDNDEYPDTNSLHSECSLPAYQPPSPPWQGPSPRQQTTSHNSLSRANHSSAPSPSHTNTQKDQSSWRSQQQGHTPHGL